MFNTNYLISKRKAKMKIEWGMLPMILRYMLPPKHWQHLPQPHNAKTEQTALPVHGPLIEKHGCRYTFTLFPQTSKLIIASIHKNDHLHQRNIKL
jgi:hypothetical protein